MGYDYKTLGSSPISPNSTVGDDIRFEPEFEWLQEEFIKSSKAVLAPTGNSGKKDGARFIYLPVDWPKVVESCGQILQSRSKDFRVAVWLTCGLAESHGLAGAADGLDVCVQLLDTHWEGLHPAGAKARANSLRLLTDYLKERLTGKDPARSFEVSADDLPHIERAIDLVLRLDTIMRVKLPEAPPMLRVLDSLLQDKSRQLKETAVRTEPQKSTAPERQIPQPSTVAAAPNPTSPGAQPGPPLSTGIVAAPPPDFDFAKPGDRFRYFSGLHEAAAKLHAYGIKNSPKDPAYYRWIRVVHWTPLEYGQDMTTIPLSGPNQTLVSHLESLSESRRGMELVIAAESQFGDYWFWLDLQRYVSDALDNLGKDFHLAREAVHAELRFLLRRFPFFAKLSTQDGLPVATEATLAWLDELCHGSDNYGAGHPDLVITSVNSGSTQDATGLAIDHGVSLESNLETAREYLRQCRNVRDRFIAHMKLGRYLAGSKETDLAYGYLDSLDSAVVRHRLEEWDPDLALSAMSELYVCLQQLVKSRKDDKEPIRTRSRELLARIARLDPVSASMLSRRYA